MREKEIEKILVHEVRKHGGLSYKFTSPGNAGVPDRIIVLSSGAVIFAELKASQGRPTRLQQKQIDGLKARRADVRLIRGLIGLSEFFVSQGWWDSADRVERLLVRGER